MALIKTSVVTYANSLSTPSFPSFLSGIICGPGSFVVQFGDHLRSWDHLWTHTEQLSGKISAECQPNLLKSVCKWPQKLMFIQVRCVSSKWFKIFNPCTSYKPKQAYQCIFFFWKRNEHKLSLDPLMKTTKINNSERNWGPCILIY